MEREPLGFPKESLFMRFALGLGFEGVAWSLRRLYCPVGKDALVLEVGSGGNPYPRSNILLDAHESTNERNWAPLVADRPTVLGLVENLPFRDGAFDFVIASHVLEHSANPERFLGELQRVARAGYIEVPDAFFERITPYRYHRLEITLRNEQLRIRKKRAWMSDPDLVELYGDRLQPLLTTARFPLTGSVIPRHPFAFHVRYYWRNRINFVVLNPNEDATWACQESEHAKAGDAVRYTAKGLGLKMLRRILSQRSRNKKIDLSSLLRCPTCHAVDLLCSAELVRCPACGGEYPIRQGIPQLSVPLEKVGFSQNIVSAL